MTSGERGYNVTMIGAINAGGGYMPPILIFPRVNFKDFMTKGGGGQKVPLEEQTHQGGQMKSCFLNVWNIL